MKKSSWFNLLYENVMLKLCDECTFWFSHLQGGPTEGAQMDIVYKLYCTIQMVLLIVVKGNQ